MKKNERQNRAGEWFHYGEDAGLCCVYQSESGEVQYVSQGCRYDSYYRYQKPRH